LLLEGSTREEIYISYTNATYYTKCQVQAKFIYWQVQAKFIEETDAPTLSKKSESKHITTLQFEHT
jgi:hypothetical protein